jgi:hypothetical protein
MGSRKPLAPPGAPSPRFEGRKKGHRRARAAKNRAGEALAFIQGNLTETLAMSLIPTASEFDSRHPEAPAAGGPRRMAADSVFVAILRGSLRSRLWMTHGCLAAAAGTILASGDQCLSTRPGMTKNQSANCVLR